ncbi:unnamed protein product [Chondrus crispus]|uniref:Mitochondrial carrier protein n=1 Tax=Chondrus crispus TaxID=2769 RepID=R7QSK4_CHOCR|nr:unnamed protein product [Chondrus crispus]CDF40370.1 unnamed protein product [Chondrus crispus]|eukprot:XP_005710664.1 unnamed protein product [Chondrus crispus]
MPIYLVSVCARRPRAAPTSSITAGLQARGGSGDGTGGHKRGARDGRIRGVVATAIPERVRVSARRVYVSAGRRARAVWESNSVKYLIAGAIAGIVSRTAVSPLEVVATVNMCTTGATRPLLVELRALFAAEGMRGFFKGNTANCLKVAPTKGIQFVAFEALKRVMYGLRDQRREGADGPLMAWERFMAGGFAGMTAASICYPLDVAKTLLTAHPERFSGVMQTMVQVARTEGGRGLYKGLSPTLVAMMPYAGLDFAIYEQLKLFYLKRKNKEANLWVLLFIGAFAGAVAQTACHPLDVVRKRLQLQGIGGRPVQYRTMVEAAVGIVKKEGKGALLKGLQPMYVSAIPSAGVSYVVYERVKRMLGVRSFQ